MDIDKNAKGFTLIELIFVLVILAILFSIVVVTYPKLVRNMKVRSDRSSAAYITKAIRGWYVERMSDSNQKEEFKTFVLNNLYLKTVKLSELSSMGVDAFVDSNYRPYSLIDDKGRIVDNQIFCVGVIGEGIDMKFVITVETDDERLEEGIGEEVAENYEGTSIGVIYIED